MVVDDRSLKHPTPKERQEGDMGEGSFLETHEGQDASPQTAKGPRHMPQPPKDKKG